MSVASKYQAWDFVLTSVAESENFWCICLSLLFLFSNSLWLQSLSWPNPSQVGWRHDRPIGLLYKNFSTPIMLGTIIACGSIHIMNLFLTTHSLKKNAYFEWSNPIIFYYKTNSSRSTKVYLKVTRSKRKQDYYITSQNSQKLLSSFNT